MASPEEKAAGPRSRRGGVVVPHRANARQRLAAWAVWLVVRSLSATVRWRLHDPRGLVASNPPGQFIFCIWHNRLALALILYERYLQRRQPARHMAAMVSASRDGAFLARVLELFRVQPVRGSTSRRGPQALRELVAWGEQGWDLAITPDGPRGPREIIQEGVVAVAQLTGLPILPVSYRLHWKIRAKSWDQFLIPLPFTRCEVRVGDLLHIPREASDEEREALRERLQSAMTDLSADSAG